MYSVHDFCVPAACSTAEKKILVFVFDNGTRNRKFERLEPQFQTSATRSAPKEDTKSAVALAHSWECTKELIPGLPNFGSVGTFGAKAEKRNVLRKKTAANVLPVSLQSGLFFLFRGQCNTGAVG